MEFKEKLVAIQTELKAPKDKHNTFGNYNYRSCEGILEAVKPLLKKYGIVLTIRDEIEHIGDRFYIKATAYVEDTESERFYSCSAFAREDDSKKGMDAAQVTGSSSSYARKYALNGLFLIDDTKDADTDEFSMQNQVQRREAGERAGKNKNAIQGNFCGVCGKAVSDKVAQRSMELYGGIYCSKECADQRPIG